ncbi:hypothetical protein [Bradyrhizobium sp. S69]|jgi:hypothetical protein|uniref:hypothetical protein n=1 Tax=Bradyrhizobium sp. S69 TaxID=1641856 RepID=UPI00131AE026|nr:hypothetical protein [Bradyrhizobium sp. S69]
MTEQEFGLLVEGRRGTRPGVVLILMLLAASSGAVAWNFYGDELRSQLGMSREEEAPRFSANEFPSATPPNDQQLALIRDLQASEKRTSDQLDTALQVLISLQTTSKALSDAVAGLAAKVDALPRPAVPVARRPPPAASRKPPAEAPQPAETDPAPADH